MDLTASHASPSSPPRVSRFFTQYYGMAFFCLVMAFLAGVFFVLKPMLDAVKSTNANITSTLRALDEERAYVRSLDQSLAAAQRIPSEVLTDIDRALPRAENIPQLLVLFEEAATRNGLRLSNVSFAENTMVGQRASTSSVAELTAQLTLSGGDYAHLKKCIRDLESSLRLLDVVGITVSSQGKEASYAVQLKTYSYRPSVRTSASR